MEHFKVALVACVLTVVGIEGTGVNRTFDACINAAGSFYVNCAESQPLHVLSATTSEGCANDSARCGLTVDLEVTNYLASVCSTGASQCSVTLSSIPPISCAIKSVTFFYSCGAAQDTGNAVVGTTRTPDLWWENYGSWQFTVIWCIIGCVVIIVIIAVTLVLCGCCPKQCHRYHEPNTISKLALMSLTNSSTLDRSAMFEYSAGSNFSLNYNDQRGQSDGRSETGARTPDGSVTGKLGGQLSGSQATLDRSSTLGRQSTADRTPSLSSIHGGRITASQGIGDKGSTLSRHSENGGRTSSVTGSAAALSRASTLSRSREALSTEQRRSATLTKQHSFQDSGISGGYDETDISGIEFGTKKRGKQDPQMAYFGQKSIGAPAEMSGSTLKRQTTATSPPAESSGRPQRLFQKNNAATLGRDASRTDTSPTDASSVVSPNNTARRGWSFSAVSDSDLTSPSNARAATLSRLHAKGRNSSVDDLLHPLRTQTLTRSSTKTHESNRSRTMSLEEAIASGHIDAASSPAWSSVITPAVLAATLPRQRTVGAAPAEHVSAQRDDANAVGSQQE